MKIFGVGWGYPLSSPSSNPLPSLSILTPLLSFLLQGSAPILLDCNGHTLDGFDVLTAVCCGCVCVRMFSDL